MNKTANNLNINNTENIYINNNVYKKSVKKEYGIKQILENKIFKLNRKLNG